MKRSFIVSQKLLPRISGRSPSRTSPSWMNSVLRLPPVSCMTLSESSQQPDSSFAVSLISERVALYCRHPSDENSLSWALSSELTDRFTYCRDDVHIVSTIGNNVTDRQRGHPAVDSVFSLPYRRTTFRTPIISPPSTNFTK